MYRYNAYIALPTHVGPLVKSIKNHCYMGDFIFLLVFARRVCLRLFRISGFSLERHTILLQQHNIVGYSINCQVNSSLISKKKLKKIRYFSKRNSKINSKLGKSNSFCCTVLQLICLFIGIVFKLTIILKTKIQSELICWPNI